MTMTDFHKYKQNDETWYRQSSILAQEGMATKFASLWMKGEFDDQLQWPFKGKIKVQLVIQRPCTPHIANHEDCGRLFGRRDNYAFGFPTFIAHKDLYTPKKEMEYLKNDNLE